MRHQRARRISGSRPDSSFAIALLAILAVSGSCHEQLFLCEDPQAGCLRCVFLVIRWLKSRVTHVFVELSSLQLCELECRLQIRTCRDVDESCHVTSNFGPKSVVCEHHGFAVQGGPAVLLVEALSELTSPARCVLPFSPCAGDNEWLGRAFCTVIRVGVLLMTIPNE